MSDILTKVNQIGLNTDFPISGQNNSSAGFRQNSRAVLAGFQQASDELTKFQNTRFSFVGDAAGKSDRIGNAMVFNTSDPNLEVNFTLANVLPAGAVLSTKGQDFDLQIDAKGRIVQVTPTTHTISWAVGGENQEIGTDASSLGIGTGTVHFPTYRFNGLGRLIATGTRSVSYGLNSHKLASGALLIGDSTNSSKELAPPPSGAAYALVANGPTVSWQPVGAGTIQGVIGGLGIKVTPDPSAPVVQLDIGNTEAKDNIRDQDLIVWHDLRDNLPKNTTVANLRAQLAKIESDTAPILGGDLDTKNYSIRSSTGSLVLKSGSSNPASTITVAQTGISIQGTGSTPIVLQGGPVSVTGTSLLLQSSGDIGLTGKALTVLSTSTNLQSSGAVTLGGVGVNINSTGALALNGKSVGITSEGALTLKGTALDYQGGSIGLRGSDITVQGTGPMNIQSDDTVQIGGSTLRLNNTLWPTTRGQPGQFMIMGVQGLTWYTEEEVEAQTLAQTVFVAPHGTDGDGNGAFTNPYLTINKALTTIPTNTNAHWTIVLMGNLYNEDVVVQNFRRISFESFFDSTNTVVKGDLQIGSNVDEFNMSNITWDISDRASDTGPAMIVSGGLVRGTIKNCGFLKADRQQVALGLYGPTTGRVQFLDCDIRGITVNEMILSDDGEVLITSLLSKLDNNIPIVSVDTDRMLTLNDVGKYLRVNVSVPNEVMIPDSEQVEFNLGATIRIAQTGIGPTSITPTGNVTVNTPNGYALRRRYSRAELIYVGNNIWDLSGDLDENIIIAPVTRVDSDQISADDDTITVDNG